MEPSTATTVTSVVGLIGTVVVAVATVLLWRVTKVLADETRRMANLGSAPHVVATLEPNRWSQMHADLEVENTGNATAYDIQLSFDPPLKSGEARQGLPIPLQTISVLKPGRSVSSYVSEFGPLMESTYSVSVSWLRKHGGEEKDREVNTYVLDLSGMEAITRLGSGDPLVQIADRMKKLQEDVHRVVYGQRKVSVDAFTSADRQAENEMLQARWAREGGEAPLKAEVRPLWKRIADKLTGIVGKA